MTDNQLACIIYPVLACIFAMLVYIHIMILQEANKPLPVYDRRYSTQAARHGIRERRFNNMSPYACRNCHNLNGVSRSVLENDPYWRGKRDQKRKTILF